jgi:hypothetical protein
MATVNEIVDLLEAFGQDLASDTIASLKAKGHAPMGQSGLAGSVRYKVSIRGNSVEMNLSMDEYWKYIDQGTKGVKKRGSAADRERMVKSLENWITTHNINPLAIYKSKLKDPSKSKVKFADARKSLAWAIKKAINKKGIIKRFGYRGSGFFTSLIDDGRVSQLEDKLTLLLGEHVKVDIRQILEG